MKIAITGHTKGIGKALATEAKLKDYEVKGLSRSTGHDITLTSIIDEIKDCDVFINNAYAPYYQTQILKDIIKEWQHQDKLIVNISSKMSILDNAPEGLHTYFRDKYEQNEIIRKQSIRAFPKVMNVILGLTDTEMSKVYDVETKMSTRDVATVIFNLIEAPVSVQQVMLDAPGFDWKQIG